MSRDAAPCTTDQSEAGECAGVLGPQRPVESGGVDRLEQDSESDLGSAAEARMADPLDLGAEQHTVEVGGVERPAQVSAPDSTTWSRPLWPPTAGKRPSRRRWKPSSATVATSSDLSAT